MQRDAFGAVDPAVVGRVVALLEEAKGREVGVPNANRLGKTGLPIEPFAENGRQHTRQRDGVAEFRIPRNGSLQVYELSVIAKDCRESAGRGGTGSRWR